MKTELPEYIKEIAIALGKLSKITTFETVVVDDVIETDCSWSFTKKGIGEIEIAQFYWDEAERYDHRIGIAAGSK